LREKGKKKGLEVRGQTAWKRKKKALLREGGRAPRENGVKLGGLVGKRAHERKGIYYLRQGGSAGYDGIPGGQCKKAVKNSRNLKSAKKRDEFEGTSEHHPGERRFKRKSSGETFQGAIGFGAGRLRAAF